MKFAIKTLAIALAFATSACGYSKAKKFETLLENSTGDSYTIAKLNTETEGYVVYRNDSTGEYVAYNLSKFEKSKHKTLTSYLASATGANDVVRHLTANSQWIQSGYWAGGFWQNTYAYYTQCDADGYCQNFWYITGSYWVPPYYVDTSHNYTWYEGNGMRFNSAQSAIKDMETLGAMIEKSEQAVLEKTLTLKYGLSQERSQVLAKLAGQFKQITNQRELTTEDQNYFSKQAFGVEFEKVQAALKGQTGSASMSDLITKASQVNGVSPEQARQILMDVTQMTE